jgi:hypothetical protein
VVLETTSEKPVTLPRFKRLLSQHQPKDRPDCREYPLSEYGVGNLEALVSNKATLVIIIEPENIAFQKATPRL